MVEVRSWYGPGAVEVQYARGAVEVWLRCTLMVRSRYGRGTLVVRSSDAHGAVLVQSRYARGALQVRFRFGAVR